MNLLKLSKWKLKGEHVIILYSLETIALHIIPKTLTHRIKN